MNFSLNMIYALLTIVFCLIKFSTAEDEGVLGLTTLSLQQYANIQNGMISSLEPFSKLKNEQELAADAVKSIVHKVEAKAKRTPENKIEKNESMKQNMATNSNGTQTKEQIAYKAYSAYIKKNNTHEKSRKKRETSYPSLNLKMPITSNFKMEKTEKGSLHPTIIVKRSFKKISESIIPKNRRSVETYGYLNRIYRDIPSDGIELQVKDHRDSINEVNPIIMTRLRRATEAQMSQSGQVEGMGEDKMSSNGTVEGGSGSGNRRKGGGRRKGGNRKNGGGKRKKGTNDSMNPEGEMNVGVDSEMGSGEVSVGGRDGEGQRKGEKNGNEGRGRRRGGSRRRGSRGKNGNRGEGNNGSPGMGAEGNKNRDGDAGNRGGGMNGENINVKPENGKGDSMNEENMDNRNQRGGMNGGGRNEGETINEMNRRPESGKGNGMNEENMDTRNQREGMNGGGRNEGETNNEMNGGNMNGSQEKDMNNGGMKEENEGSRMPGGIMDNEMPGKGTQKQYHGSLDVNNGDEKDNKQASMSFST